MSRPAAQSEEEKRGGFGAVLDKGKPVVRRGRKAMGSYPPEGGRLRLPGYRRDGRDP